MIREARSRWDAHENAACRRVRERAMAAYEELAKEEREEIPEELRVWLRYRSEKYFGKGRAGNGMSSKPLGSQKAKPKEKPQQHAVASRKVASAVGPLYLVSSRRGLCGLYFGHRVESSALLGDNRRDRFLNQAEEELAEYFGGKREVFGVALDARGSQFQRAVWGPHHSRQTRGWRAGGGDRKSQGDTRGRHRQWGQSHFHHRPMSPCDRERWVTHWFWGRIGDQAPVVAARGGPFKVSLIGDRTLTPC